MQAVLVLFILSVLVDGNYCSGYLNHGRRSCIRIVVVPFVSAILTSMHLLRAMLTLLHTHTPRYIYIYIHPYTIIHYTPILHLPIRSHDSYILTHLFQPQTFIVLSWYQFLVTP